MLSSPLALLCHGGIDEHEPLLLPVLVVEEEVPVRDGRAVEEGAGMLEICLCRMVGEGVRHASFVDGAGHGGESSSGRRGK